jgi:hypothetical protein
MFDMESSGELLYEKAVDGFLGVCANGCAPCGNQVS